MFRLLAHLCVPGRALRLVNDEDNLPTYCAWQRSLLIEDEARLEPLRHPRLIERRN